MSTSIFTSIIRASSVLLLAASFTLLLNACKKEETPTPPTPAENVILFPEIPADVDAVLLAQRSTTTPLLPGLPDTEVSIVNAFFGNDAPYSDAGLLKLNNIALRQLSNNVYLNDDLVLDYKLGAGTKPRWIAAGGTGFSAFNIQTNIVMPGKLKLSDLPEEVVLNQTLNLSVESFPTNADSIIWQLGDTKGNTRRKLTATNTVSFSATELNGLEAGDDCIIQVAAYRTESISNSGKKFYFINQTIDYSYIEFR